MPGVRLAADDLSPIVTSNGEHSAMNIRSQIYGVAPSAESPLVLTKRPKGVQANDLTTIPVSRETGRCGDTRMGERPLIVRHRP